MSKPTKRFVIKYTDANDKGCPVFEWKCYAYDTEHAREKFIESDSEEFGEWTGWEILSIDRPRTPFGKVETKFDRVAA